MKKRNSGVDIVCFLKGVLFLSVIIFSGNTYSATYTVNTSANGTFTPLGTKNATTPNLTNINTTISNWNDRPVGYGFATRAPQASNSSCTYNRINLKTIDNYTGIEIADGILLVIYNSNVTGKMPQEWSTLTSSGQWDQYGKYTQTAGPNGGCNWTGGPDPTKLRNIAVNASASIKYGVYVSSSAVVGTYTMPPLILYKGAANTQTVSTEVIPSSTLNVVQPVTTCTISPPGPVDFGVINLSSVKDGDILSVRNGDININCSNPSGLVENSSNLNVSVTGTVGRYNAALKMRLVSSENAAPAEIRGLIGPGIVNTGVCFGNTSYTGWIDFSSSGKANSVGNLKLGATNIPYSFTLCSNGLTNVGNATAQATVDIDWD